MDKFGIAYGDTGAVPAAQAPAGLHVCPACFKAFTSENNLERHLESSLVCTAWVETGTLRPALAGDHSAAQPLAGTGSNLVAPVPQTQRIVRPAYAVLTGTMISDAAAVAGTKCVACMKDYANTGSLARHYKCSVACDRTRARDIMAALRAAAADFEDFLGPAPAALQDTGLPEPDEGEDPYAETQVIEGPRLTSLPAPLNVRAG